MSRRVIPGAAHRQQRGSRMSSSAQPTARPHAMTHLKVRSIPFQFGDDFQWNLANPFFGFAMNSLSFGAPAFERYMVAAVMAPLRASARQLIVGWAEIPAKLSRLLASGNTPRTPQDPGQFSTVPRMELLRMVCRLIRSQHPRHSPETEQTISECERGRDVVDWYGGVRTVRVRDAHPAALRAM